MNNVVPQFNDYRRLQMCIERGKNSAFAEVFRVTPEMAQMLLDLNAGNRPLRENTSRKYARQMEMGQWALTGETVCITRSGKLRNGQHRLDACIRAGVPFDTFVAFGVADEAFSVMDSGKVRRASDILGIAGHADSAVVASACRWAYMVSANCVQSGLLHPNNQEVLSFAEAHPGIADSIVFCRENNPMKLARPGVLAALHYLFAKQDRALADSFVTQVFCGKGLSEGPLLILHHRMTDNARSKRKMPVNEVAAILIKGWNAIRENRPAKLFKWARDEVFPVIK